jgi:hypothetical protein
MVFPVWPVLRCYKQDNYLEIEEWSELLVDELVRGLLQFSCCEKLVAEVGDSSGSQRKGNVCCWKLLQSNG